MKKIIPMIALLVSGCGHDHDHHNHDHGHDDHNHAHQNSSSHHDHDHDHQGIEHQHGAHQHGVGDLAIMQDQQQLMVTMQLPADSLWGFEYTPKTDQERALVERTFKQLVGGHRFFKFKGEAICQPVSVEVLKPEALEDPNFNGHMDVQANWLFECDDVAKVDGLVTDIFLHFPRIEQLNTQLLLENVNSGTVLVPTQANVAW